VETLTGFGFAVERLGAERIGSLSREAIQVLYLPGGWYRFQATDIERVRAFVAGGGGCVGTCAGSYLIAGELGLVPGRASLANMRGRIYIEPQRGEHPILEGVVQRCTRHNQRQWEPIALTHLGGPFMFPDDRSTIVASYDGDGQVGALVAAPYARGRAVAIASHPELPVAELPIEDPSRLHSTPLPQGEVRLMLRNAVHWAAGEGS